jgi:hypothetical protein
MAQFVHFAMGMPPALDADSCRNRRLHNRLRKYGKSEVGAVFSPN